MKDIFALPNWRKHVPSLAEAFPNSREGGWKHGKDFLRIDGTKTSAERGEMVKEFNDDLSQIKCFLIVREKRPMPCYVHPEDANFSPFGTFLTLHSLPELEELGSIFARRTGYVFNGMWFGLCPSLHLTQVGPILIGCAAG